MRFVKYAGIVVGALIVFVLVLIGVLSVTRGTPVKQVIAEGDRGGPPTVSDTLFPRTIELFTETHIEPGNKVQILLNGDGTYPPLWKDIASAKKTLTVQMYYAQPGAVADTMAKYLIDRARAHVRVLLLMDAFGSQPLKGDWVDNLKKNGVEFAWLRPLRWYTLHKATQRSHVRVVVVDGRVGYTGGFGLADYWLGDGHHDEQWRESNVRFEGPTVAALQAAFASGWAEATGELITGDLFFPPISFAEGGTVNAGLMHSIPTIGSTPAERLLALSIAASRHRLYITNSYFVPNDEFCNGLIKAVHRGVDVRVLTVSSKTDVKTTWYAGRALYEKLLAGGVRIYEYQPTMMHAKAMVVDGAWSMFGSANFDNRSLELNDELNVAVADRGLAQRLEANFQNDLRSARELELESWRHRSPLEKVRERFWAFFGEMF